MTEWSSPNLVFSNSAFRYTHKCQESMYFSVTLIPMSTFHRNIKDLYFVVCMSQKQCKTWDYHLSINRACTNLHMLNLNNEILRPTVQAL